MKIACQHCGQRYDVENVSAGAELECSACGKTFRATAGADSRRGQEDAGWQVLKTNLNPIIAGLLFLLAAIAGLLWLPNRDDIATLIGSFWLLLAAIFFKLRQ